MIGGLYGAMLQALSISIIRLIILQIGSPELLAICVFGLSLVAVLSGSTLLKGLAAACIGLMVATAGDDPQTGTLRWTFDTIYLYDGLPVVPLALGLFAIPEIADMVITRQTISGGANVGSRWSQLEGIKDVFRNKFLVLRCATIGSGLGAIPGIGASIIDWIAYGHAVRSIKDSGKTFGKGDVRGVIASESSNNAKEGGALLPTIAFGVPGSASMALILGAFLIHGLVPGPELLAKRLDITYTLVWSVAIANILGAGICFMFANQLAKIALVRIGILAPVVLAVTFIGAFQGQNSWGDISALLIFGFVGWVMKRLRWPRPPLILGFVLGGLVERYMFISVERYGWEWLWVFREGTFAPWVDIIILMTLYGILAPTIRNYLSRLRSGRSVRGRIAFQSQNLDPGMYFNFAVLVMFAVTIYVASGWEFGARLVPSVIGWSGVLFTSGVIIMGLFYVPAAKPAEMENAGAEAARNSIAGNAFKTTEEDVHFDIQADYGDLSTRAIFVRAGTYFAWLVGFDAVALIIGLLPAMLIFLITYIRFEGKENWKVVLAVSLPLWIGSYFLFHQILLVIWPLSVVGDLFPVLRTIEWLNLF